MRPPADLIWCGVNAPVIQGVFLGLGIAAVGLVVFPFGFAPVRPSAGRLAGFGAASRLVRWGRRIAWLVGAMTLVTLGGYVALFTSTDGKFCTARLDGREQTAVIIWSCIAAVTFGVLTISAILRALARRLSKE